MSLLDSIKIALSSILAHKLRSALTMLGIIIGVGSIITVVAIGQGGEAMLKSKFAGSGGNNLMPIQFKADINDEFNMGGHEIPEVNGRRYSGSKTSEGCIPRYYNKSGDGDT